MALLFVVIICVWFKGSSGVRTCWFHRKKHLNWRGMQREYEVERCNSEERWWYDGCLGKHPTLDQNFFNFVHVHYIRGLKRNIFTLNIHYSQPIFREYSLFFAYFKTKIHYSLKKVDVPDTQTHKYKLAR